MLKRNITYENPFTNEQVTEEHYFHISKADLVEMEVGEHNTEYHANDGQKYTGMQAKLKRIMDSEDGNAIMAELKDMVRRSYGKKVGDRFVKTPEIWEEFSSSEAYSELIFELCTDAEIANQFINGIVPRNLEEIAEEVKQKAAALKEQAQNGSSSASTPAPDHIREDDADRKRVIAEATPENPVVLTRAELAEIDHASLSSGLADGRYKLS